MQFNPVLRCRCVYTYRNDSSNIDQGSRDLESNAGIWSTPRALPYHIQNLFGLYETHAHVERLGYSGRAGRKLEAEKVGGKLLGVRRRRIKFEEKIRKKIRRKN